MPRISITKTYRLIVFKEITSFYSENDREPINLFYGENANFLHLKVATVFHWVNGDVADCCGRH
jgi:hypothetical protein